ncbi:hypothetical protein [Paenibacillus stellifer]|uniref:hypothetical protein n=1 Tax=Paenibacillus stellifer TaxID=169760 RepID=UPI000A953832|nr:hypothetical protein [Paenibacillus stellifer]
MSDKKPPVEDAASVTISDTLQKFLDSQNPSLFNKWWNNQGIMGTPEGQKLLHHPLAGNLYLSYISFRSTEIEGANITIQMPIDEGTRHKLKQL